MPESHSVVVTTVGNREEAERIAEMLVSRRLAACVQITAVSSVYVWNGEVRKDAEHLLLIKSSAARYPDIETALLENHSYELPEIIQLPIERGSGPYLAWLDQVTGSAPPGAD